MGYRAIKPPPAPATLEGGTVKIDSNNFYQFYYRQLIGCTITAVGENAEGFPYIVAKRPCGEEFTCEISQDEEGNGPGFLFGLPNPYDYYAEPK